MGPLNRPPAAGLRHYHLHTPQSAQWLDRSDTGNQVDYKARAVVYVDLDTPRPTSFSFFHPQSRDQQCTERRSKKREIHKSKEGIEGITFCGTPFRLTHLSRGCAPHC